MFFVFVFGYSYFAFLSWRVGGKLSLITVDVKAGEDLFSEKTANEVSASNNIGRLPKTLDAVQ